MKRNACAALQDNKDAGRQNKDKPMNGNKGVKAGKRIRKTNPQETSSDESDSDAASDIGMYIFCIQFGEKSGWRILGEKLLPFFNV